MSPLESSFMTNWRDLLVASSARPVAYSNGKDLAQRLMGAFYTPEAVGRLLVRDLMQVLPDTPNKALRIIDPFGGDGRLLRWFIEEFKHTPRFDGWVLDVHLWECSELATEAAKAALSTLKLPGRIEITCTSCDTFTRGLNPSQRFDICITNPPWEVLKPDPKELDSLSSTEQERYISLLKERATLLDLAFGIARPTRKFSGWGVNLARVGTELSIRLLKPSGAYAIVLPASLFGDQISSPLRHWLFEEYTPNLIRSFPAESRLFEKVDQDFVTLAGTAGRRSHRRFQLVQHSTEEKSTDVVTKCEIEIESTVAANYAISLRRSPSLGYFIDAMVEHPTLEHLEPKGRGLFKLGRELDETRITEKLTEEGKIRFIKGRDIARYGACPDTGRFLRSDVKLPRTIETEKVVWRDVARQSSQRRVIATLLPSETCTGNSLNIAAPVKARTTQLRALLALFNSLVFEAQVRAGIATNHVSTGAVRKFRVPVDWSSEYVDPLATLVGKALKEPSLKIQAEIDRLIFAWFGFPQETIDALLSAMTAFDPTYIEILKKNVEGTP